MANGSLYTGLKVFAGRNSIELAKRVCMPMSIDLGLARTIPFPDGELIVKLDEDVRGRDCYVVISTGEPVNDNIMEMLIFIDCLRRASAGRVSIVIPYFGYGRQDRKDEGRVPITAKLVANIMTSAGADRVLAIDLHAAQIQGFFDLPVDHLSATPVFVEYFQKHKAQMPNLCLVSPDVGNVKVAESMANLLGGDLAIINKRRTSGSLVSMGHIIGDVEGKTVLMFDDMISTAGTVCEAAKLVKDKGAREVIAAATHGLFVGSAVDRLMASAISRIIVTDTVPLLPRCKPLEDRIVQLSVGQLVGEAIVRIHNNQSVSALFNKTAGVKR